MEEIDEASSYIKGEVDTEAEIFWGVVFDEEMADEVQITVIATGIDREYQNKVVKIRDVTPEEAENAWTVSLNGQVLDTPTFQRNQEDSAPLMKEAEGNRGKKGIFKRGFFRDDLDYPTFLRAKGE
jgi:cell division protein FtsZ